MYKDAVFLSSLNMIEPIMNTCMVAVNDEMVAFGHRAILTAFHAIDDSQRNKTD